MGLHAAHAHQPGHMEVTCPLECSAISSFHLCGKECKEQAEVDRPHLLEDECMLDSKFKAAEADRGKNHAELCHLEDMCAQARDSPSCHRAQRTPIVREILMVLHTFLEA